MQVEKTIKVIEKITKSYTFEGKTGISRKVRALVDSTDIFEFKFTDEEIPLYESLPLHTDVDVIISFTSPKERLQAKIVKVF